MMHRVLSATRAGVCALVLAWSAAFAPAMATSVTPAIITDAQLDIDTDAIAARRAARSPAERRLHASLVQAEAAARSGAHSVAAGSGLPAQLLDGERVLVEIRHEVLGRNLDALPGLRALGAEIRRPGHRGLTEAWVPALQLGQVAVLPGVQQVSPARRVRTLAGAVTSAGVAAGQVEAWHLAGLDGSGVTVAVIDSFDDSAGQIAALQASGDWPGPTQISLVPLASATFGDSGSAHGNAALEVAFDIAPGADFIAYDVATVGDWRDAIDLAVAAGADVIVSALAAPLDGIGDGTALPGSVAERVEAAASAGVLYLNAAGNERLRHWGGLYASSPSPDILDWSGAGDRYNPIVDAAGVPACVPDGTVLQAELFWNDWIDVDHDYDLELRELTDDDGNLVWLPVANSSDVQDGAPGQLPQEHIAVVVTSSGLGICDPESGRYAWRINRVAAPTPRNLQFFSSHDLQFRVEARSLVFPADSAAALAVAALDVADSVALDDSSEGPILAPGGGLPGGAEMPKPDLAAFAGVDTISFGAGGFTGTSAAAAHAAGMAALLKQRHPDFDRDQLADRLRAIAATGSNDLGDVGHDFRHGAGRLRFQAEVGLVVTGSPATAETDTVLSPVEVELRDDEGLVVLSGPASQVEVAIGNDPSAGAATLSGTLSLPLLDGMAAFTDLSIDEPGFAYTLDFEVDSDAAGAESAAFNVVLGGPGVPSQLVFSVQPSNAAAGMPVAPVITVEVQDSEGAVVVSDSSTDISLVLIDDPGATGLVGNGPVVVSNGVASFPALSLDRAGSGYRLRAQTGVFGVVGADSVAFDVLPGAATRLTLLSQPPNGEVDTALGTIQVAVTDALGNAQTTDHSTAVSVALQDNGAGANLSGTLIRTVSAGVASFDDLSLDTIGSGYTLIFSADIGLLEEALTIDDFSLSASQTAPRSATGGVANRALVRGLRFTGTVSGIGGNSSYASDLRMDVSGPSGSGFAVGGFNDPAPVTWAFQGSGSTSDGTYVSSHEMIFSSLQGGFTADAGTWQFQFRNDWSGASATMHWTDVTVDLLKSDLYVISDSFAVGGTEAEVVLGNLLQIYDGTPREVSVSTDPPGLAVTLTYSGSASAPVLPGFYDVLAVITEPGYFGSAEDVLEVQPIAVSVSLQDLVQTFTGAPLAATVVTDPPGVAVEVTYDGETDLPVDVGVYEVVATVVQTGHQGMADGLFEITAPDEVVITFVGLAQTYDGTARVVSVITDPPGIDVAITYAGETDAPVDAGSYAVEATVIEPGFSGSASDLLVVAQAATVTTLSSDVDPAPIGEPLTLTAEVSGIDPSGSVTFMDGAAIIGGCSDVALSGAGATVSAQCVTDVLPGGSRALSATYSGDLNHLPSDAALAQQIDPYVTALELDQLGSSSDRGEPASFTATLSVPDGAIFEPSGTLSILASQGVTNESCQVAVTAAGSHGCDINFAAPAAGVFEVSASFQPDDGNFFASANDEDGAHTVLRVADLAIAKSADPPAAGPGEALDFIVVVDNLGPDEAVAVNVLDAMPTGFLSALWVCEGDSGAACAEDDGVGDIDQTVDLPAGGRLTFTIGGVLDDPLELPLVNSAMVVTTAPGFTRDPEVDNNSASASIVGEDVFADGFEAVDAPDPEPPGDD